MCIYKIVLTLEMVNIKIEIYGNIFLMNPGKENTMKLWSWSQRRTSMRRLMEAWHYYILSAFMGVRAGLRLLLMTSEKRMQLLGD